MAGLCTLPDSNCSSFVRLRRFVGSATPSIPEEWNIRSLPQGLLQLNHEISLLLLADIADPCREFQMAFRMQLL